MWRSDRRAVRIKPIEGGVAAPCPKCGEPGGSVLRHECPGSHGPAEEQKELPKVELEEKDLQGKPSLMQRIKDALPKKRLSHYKTKKKEK